MRAATKRPGDVTSIPRADSSQTSVDAKLISIIVPIPGPQESAFKFRRAFLDSIRRSVSEAAREGLIPMDLSVECLRAVPPAVAP